MAGPGGERASWLGRDDLESPREATATSPCSSSSVIHYLLTSDTPASIWGKEKEGVQSVCLCVCACYLYPDIRVTWHLMDSAMWNKRPRLITLPRPWPFWSSSFPLGQKPILHDCVCERERETECVNAHLSERASHCCSNPLKLNQIQALRSKKQVFCCGSLRRCSRRRLEAKR